MQILSSKVELELELFDVVDLGEINQHACVQNCHADREHFRNVVFGVIHTTQLKLVHVLWGQQCLNALKSLLKVRAFPWPRVQTRNLYLALLVDEHVLRPDIPDPTFKRLLHLYLRR